MTDEHTDKVTLVTVCYNSSSFIEDTLRSVRNQCVQPDEYIIIDGGSTDGTLDIINKNKDLVTKLVTEADDGIYDAMNKGLALATKRYIGFLNSDDVLADSHVIRDLKDAMGQGFRIIYGDIAYRTRQKDDIVRYWKSGDGNFSDFADGWHTPHPAFYAETSLCREVGGFNTDYTISADFDLMLTAFRDAGNRIFYLSRALVLMREGGESGKSIANIFRGNKQVLESLRSKGIQASWWYVVSRLISKFKLRFLG